jgi:hypothetical protein
LNEACVRFEIPAKVFRREQGVPGGNSQKFSGNEAFSVYALK